MNADETKSVDIGADLKWSLHNRLTISFGRSPASSQIQVDTSMHRAQGLKMLHLIFLSLQVLHASPARLRVAKRRARVSCLCICLGFIYVECLFVLNSVVGLETQSFLLAQPKKSSHVLENFRRIFEKISLRSGISPLRRGTWFD